MAAIQAVQLGVHGTIALVTAVTALLILWGNPRRTWNQYLAFFLALVAGNFLAQAMVVMAELDALAGRLDPAAYEDLARRWRAVGAVFLVADPAVLAYFASLFPRRTAFAQRPWGLPVLAGLTLAFLGAELAWGSIHDTLSAWNPVRLAFFAYFAACYGFAAHRILDNLLREPSTVMAAQLRPVALGLLVATLPRIALVFDDVQVHLWPLAGSMEAFGSATWPPLASMAFRVSVLAALWALAWRLVERASPAAAPGRREEARGVLRVAGVVFVAFGILWAMNRLSTAGLHVLGVAQDVLGPEGEVLWYLGEFLGFGLRWVVFAGAVLHGVIRYEILAVDRTALGGAAAVAAGAAGFLAVGAVGLLAGPWAAAAVAVPLVAAGMVAARLLPDPPDRAAFRAYLHGRRLEVYRAAVASALAESGRRPGAGADLARLRGRLGLTQRDHDALLAIAEAEEAEGGSAGRPSHGPGQGAWSGRYRVLRRLAEGGQAVTYLAEDPQERRLVVLKRFHGAPGGPAEGGGRPTGPEAALRELEVARRVSHPRLVAIHDLLRLDDGVVVVMDYVEGGSLRDLLEREHRLPPGTVARLLRDALEGVQALHEADVVHGDLKPENLLLDADGRVVVADFGTARAVDPRRTLRAAPAGDGGFAGTLPYLPPERLRGGVRPTVAGDVYALGAVAWEALRGAPLDPDAPAPGPRSRHPPLPAPWAAFLARATHPDPGQRFGSLADMAAALEGLAATGPGGPAAGHRPGDAGDLRPSAGS